LQERQQWAFSQSGSRRSREVQQTSSPTATTTPNQRADGNQKLQNCGLLATKLPPKVTRLHGRAAFNRSVALVKIIKQFFEAAPAILAVAVVSETREALAQFQAEIADLQGRVAVLEAGGGKRQFNESSPRHFSAGQPAMKLRSLKAVDLAKRLGLSAEAVESAASRGSASFLEWSKRRDPASRAWLHRGNLFHPPQD